MTRICAHIDVKGDNCVQGKNYERLRKIGPADAVGYRALGARFDQVFYIDLVASLYRRRFDAGVMWKVTSSLLIPFSVIAGVAGIDNVQTLMLPWVEKVGINTQAHQKAEQLGETVRPAVLRASYRRQGAMTFPSCRSSLVAACPWART